MKNLTTASGFLVLMVLLLWFGANFTMKNFEEEMRKGMDIHIRFDDKPKGLKGVEFEICDSIYHFTYQEIRDTIYDRIGIRDNYFPCPVSVKYVFKNGEEKKFPVEKFDCAGCPGTNNYILGNDSVKYIYHP